MRAQCARCVRAKKTCFAERAKAARAIVLTTHSMEEAEQLADQVAIMARGR